MGMLEKFYNLLTKRTRNKYLHALMIIDSLEILTAQEFEDLDKRITEKFKLIDL